ncbi:unnamed protein product [Adineta steineri]|uniref:CLLAC-motif containing domain-containing protein n=1 Tax=Adineta steineri TaxID=433720 RepID=A0A819JT05_9BILA|nr:unnamed protein product [Adineta steineri]
MSNPRYSDWSSDPVSTTHTSHSSIERIVWTEDDDSDRIDRKKTSFGWCWCLKCCIIGSLLAGIGLAVVLTFYVTSKTTATEALILATSSSGSSSSLSVSTSIVTSPSSSSTVSTTSTSTSISTTTEIPGTGRIGLSIRK